MKYRNGIITLGILVALVKPIFYFPPSFTNVIYVLLGLGIAVLAYQSGKKAVQPSQPAPSEPTSVETH
jgi:hypothetical protein